MIKIPFSKQALYLFLLFVSLSSCFGSKPVAYFDQGKFDTSNIENINVPEQVIQKGDILSIKIFSDNPDATAIFNQAGNLQTAIASTESLSKSVNTSQSTLTGASTGYLVDDKGNIRLHALGLIKAEGLTKDALSALILERLKDLGVLTNPYCVIRLNNFKVTVLGEVRTPGVFTMPGEKATLMEVLGLAGDITDYGLKDRVMLIREDQGKRIYHVINLRDPRIMKSPEYYLKQNDIVYVEPDKRKPTALDQQTLQYITIAATMISAAAILIALFK
jgi:polysaccharide export outer membrane protein